MLASIKYRTFQELLDSVKLDLKIQDMEGMIDYQQLIKVALRVNYDLGIKINPSKSKCIEISKNMGKLPYDFNVLNFSLLCKSGEQIEKENLNRTYEQGLTDGFKEAFIIAEDGFDRNITNSYSVVMNVVPGINIINHNLQTTSIVLQARNAEGSVINFDILTPNQNQAIINSFISTTLTDVSITIVGNKILQIENRAEIVMNDYNESYVRWYNNGKLSEYRKLTRLEIRPYNRIESDKYNYAIEGYPNVGYIKDNFLHTSFGEGIVLVNYQSIMEDDDGNLLVLDHPEVNDYYEYALKQRIYENMMLMGEPVENKLGYINEMLRQRRNNAVSYCSTPDFNTLKKNWLNNRRAMMDKYYNIFL